MIPQQPTPSGDAAAPQPLRVMCISHTAVSRAAGRLRYAPLLDRADITVDLVTPSRWFEYGRWRLTDPPHAEDVPVHVVPIRWPNAGPATWYFHHYIGLEKTMRQVRPQLIHLWEEPWSLVALQVLKLRNKLFPTTPIVLEVDQNILKRLPPPFEQLRRHVLRNTNFVLARSVDAARVVEQCGYSGPSALLGYGVDQTIFNRSDREAARARFGFHGFTVGYVGRLIEDKGVDDLIDALALAETPVTLAIMGEGPHRAALLRRVAAHGLSDRVQFLPSHKPAEVASFMSGLDVLALLTRTTKTVREQFGRVIIEAQACGTPVIGSDCGAIPDVVGKGGWIVPERNPAAVAALIDRVAQHGLELQAVRSRAARQVGERFDYAVIANTLATAWLRTLSQPAMREPT